MKILILDNYDSFVYNLDYLIRKHGHVPDVKRNDKISLDEVEQYDKILLSPGPGIPSEAGIMMDLIKAYAPTKDIMGVCLGHQAIGQSFGATLAHMGQVLHGVQSNLEVIRGDNCLFQDIPSSLSICHYHSWTLSPDDFPVDLKIVAENQDKVIMAIEHANYKVCGVQFHPESYLTDYGSIMIYNWLRR
jgi:anthranilate synthase component 2